jgi:hypothetical protein
MVAIVLFGAAGKSKSDCQRLLLSATLSNQTELFTVELIIFVLIPLTDLIPSSRWIL